MSRHRSPQIRRLVYHRAHQLPTGAASRNGDAPLRNIILVNQVAGHVHEVVERVGAPVQLAGLVPVVPQVVSAADVGQGVDEPTVQQGQARGGE